MNSLLKTELAKITLTLQDEQFSDGKLSLVEKRLGDFIFDYLLNAPVQTAEEFCEAFEC